MSRVSSDSSVPLAAFKLAHGSAQVDTPPPRQGQNSEEILAEIGYTAEQIAALRAKHIV